jgi:DNA-binding MarR family transcriptional regulator
VPTPADVPQHLKKAEHLEKAQHLELIELAGSLDLLLAWTRRNTPTGEYSLTARTTLARLATEGPARISDLARLEGVTQPAMTGLVNRLEGEGLVRRDPDPSDARASLVALTEAGRQFVEDRRAQRTRMLAAQLEQLDPADQAALLAAGAAVRRLTQLAPTRPQF